MLIIPTSANTALVVQPPPGIETVLNFASYALLLGGAYCLWEMLLSVLLGRRPASSRWVWLGTAIGLLAIAVISGQSGFGPASFNGGEFTTAWGFIVEEWLIRAFGLSVIVLLGLRLTDSVRARPRGRHPVVGWWLLGMGAAISSGLLLGWMAGEGNTAAWQLSMGAELFAGTLAVAAVGTLLAVAAARRWRGARTAEQEL
jgi:hypothetical protein